MSTNAGRRERVWRFVLAALDVACTGLAGLGLSVPGLPTTVSRIAASYLLPVPTAPSATLAAGVAGAACGSSARRVPR